MRAASLTGVAMLLLLGITLYRGTLSPELPPRVDPSTGVNLPDLASSGPLFNDAMKQAAPWSASSAVTEDADGNITRLGSGQFAETVVYKTAAYPGGVYTLLYDGAGRFDISPRSGSVLSRSRGRILFRIFSRHGYGIRLRLARVDSNDYPRNVRLMLPGYEHANKQDVFYSPFLRELRRCTIVRFANWMHANTYATSTVWPRRATTHAFTQDGPPGVAIEYMIDLANETANRPWFTIPVGATDYWVENFAELVAKYLDPRLRPIIEYGDEVWRAGSPANRYAIMAAHNVGLHGDPLAWYSQRSMRVFQLVAQRLAGKPFVPVLSGPVPYGNNAATDQRILDEANAGRLLGAFAFAYTGDKSLRAARNFARNADLYVLSYSPRFDAGHHTGDFSFHLKPARLPMVESAPETPSRHRSGGRLIIRPPLTRRPS